MKPKVLVFSGYGLNCEEETKVAFDLAGARSDIIHINDLIAQKSILNKYQILAFPGGFAYGDDTGAGNAYANKLHHQLWEPLDRFVKKDHLVIGICNGFQIIANLGLLPAMERRYGDRQTALLPNDSARYIDRWVDLKVENDSPWLLNMDSFSAPIAHGEGKFYAKQEVLQEISQKGLVAIRYTKGDICNFQDLPANPTGTVDDIAGITDETKRILGIMPHPERGMFFTQLPHWTYLKEQYKRENKSLPQYNNSFKIFRNAVKYFN